MKGTIFKLFEDFVTESYGPDAYDDLLTATELVTSDPFVGPGTYPAGDLVALLGTASGHVGRSVDELLTAFGRFALPTLMRSVTGLIAHIDHPRDFLLELESVIHTEVRKLDPEADPARFTVEATDVGTLLLGYRSPLGLFPLVEGFLDGLGEWYGVPVGHERVAVDGTNATFEVTFGPVAGGSTSGGADAVDEADPVAAGAEQR